MHKNSHSYENSKEEMISGPDASMYPTWLGINVLKLTPCFCRSRQMNHYSDGCSSISETDRSCASLNALQLKHQ